MVDHSPIEIHAAALEALSKVYHGPRGPLSPLAPQEYSFEPDEAIRHLVHSGVLNVSGEPEEWFKPVLETLCNPHRVIELDCGCEESASISIYINGDTPPVALKPKNNQTTVLIASAEVEDLLSIVKTMPITGDAAFSANVGVAEGRALSALIDIQRQTALVSAIRERQSSAEIAAVQSKLPAIQRAIQDAGSAMLSLAWTSSACFNSLLSAALETSISLDQSLQNLVDTRLIIQRKGEYLLDPLIASWSNHLLLPKFSCSLTLRQKNLEGKVLIESLLTILSADTHLTMMYRGGGVVSFNPLNPSSLPELLARLYHSEGSLYDLTGLGNLLTDVAVFF